MINKEITVFIILDAFRWDYLTPERSPYLWELKDKSTYVKKVLSSSGFTQRSTIFTGTWPKDNGNFTMYNYSPDLSQYRFLRFVPGWLLDLVENTKLANRIVRKVLNMINFKFNLQRRFSVAHIPLRLLAKIGITEDNVPIFKPSAFYPMESLFDNLEKAGKKHRFLMFPLSQGDDQWVHEEILKSHEQQVDIVFAQFSDTDGRIHETGTQSDRATEIIRLVDSRVKEIKEYLELHYESYNLFLLGDHGMSDVKEDVDADHYIKDYMKEKGNKYGKDYFFFLSSTLVHFWWENEAALLAIKEMMGDAFFASRGYVITPDIAVKHDLPYGNREYGDLIWAANLGTLIFPDFFHRYELYKAMHGYIEKSEDMKGMGLVYRSSDLKGRVIESSDLRSSCDTICDLVGVDSPEQSEGSSWVTGA